MLYLHDIDPVALHVGPLAIRWYGLLYIVAGALGWWIGRGRVRAGRFPVTQDQWLDLCFYIMLGVILGGRLGYMLFYGYESWLQDPLAILRVWEGGMSFHGGLLGVLIALAWWSRRHRLAFWDTVDFVAPLVPPGIFCVRMGNFIGGELWGKRTGGEWGVVFPDALSPAQAPESLRRAFDAGLLNDQARHPTQLYEAGLEGMLLFVVLILLSRVPRRRYFISGCFAVLYAWFRFAVEFLREPDAHIGYLGWHWLTMGQVLSAPLFVVGVILLWRSRRAPVLGA
jgi:phosphatidylglycerol:prolipoprotein diacylglycerol transferase